MDKLKILSVAIIVEWSCVVSSLSENIQSTVLKIINSRPQVLTAAVFCVTSFTAFFLVFEVLSTFSVIVCVFFGPERCTNFT